MEGHETVHLEALASLITHLVGLKGSVGADTARLVKHTDHRVELLRRHLRLWSTLVATSDELLDQRGLVLLRVGIRIVRLLVVLLILGLLHQLIELELRGVIEETLARGARQAQRVLLVLVVLH